MYKVLPWKLTQTVILAALLIFCTGCLKKNTNISMDSLSQISRGLSAEKVNKRLSQKPAMILRLNGQDKTIVEVFMMVTGTKTVQSSIYIMGVNGAPGYYLPTTNIVDVTEAYFLLYNDDQLEFWGFLEEFGRSNDQDIRKYRKMIESAYNAENAKKAKKIEEEEEDVF